MDISSFFLNTSVQISALILIFIVAAYLLYKWVEGPHYSQTYRLDGKVVIVTGCNTGIGKEIVLDLAKRGARVYMACRNFEKCEQALGEIVSLTGNPYIFNRSLDLSSLASIRKFVENFQQEENHLDILINNAGILATPYTLTEDGFEMQFGVNHLGHFLLTNLLLDNLRASKSGRIVVLTSIAHFLGSINKQDLNSRNNYNKFAAYAQSKLANVLFTRHLAKILNGSSITVNCLHPGIVRTKIFQHDPFVKILTSMASRIILRSIKGGAQTALYLAIDPQVQGKSGDYYDRMKVSQPSAKAKDDKMAEWLWKESEKLVGLVKEG